MFELTGRVALVTGAGRGIGIGIAAALARQGALVAVNDLREDRAQRTVDAIHAANGTAISTVFDVTDYRAVAAGVDAITDALGPIDIVVNNAGIPPGGIPVKPFALSGRADWRRFVDVNLFGVLNTVHTTVGGMCDRGWGRIVTISSEAARFGMDANVSIYGASKAAAVTFSKHLALEVAQSGVTVNCVALGAMNNNAGEWGESLAATIPRRRLGTGEDAGAAVVFLASSEAAWITGQVLPVNGGSTA
ncbi:SDR family NAD(P)-dependent oxidoreductase [Mycobacterium sp. DL440]|uniref:SDR family NAD(P)-dependent oxidoreductase n=1 Tax=Mycobacterium sp. DL440 TaxID=2675523 RepID=UPI001421913B|nr:SDR family NAD(P)-dependent oxidoreductase [Mycobacterium sp. DL440]